MKLNNGVLRGVLYFIIAAGTPMVGSLDKWSNSSPRNSYELSSAILASVIAGFVAWRAYIDQSISRAVEEKKSGTQPA
jgi:hypothetical protein